MISKKLKQRVLEEATLLKQHATPEEIELLDIDELNPSQPSNCIYGQMTGSCFSPRAHELLFKCAVWPYSIELDTYVKTQMGVTRWMKFREVSEEAFSPIEYYIYHRPDKIPVLVDYLKDNRELTIEDL